MKNSIENLNSKAAAFARMSFTSRWTQKCANRFIARYLVPLILKDETGELPNEAVMAELEACLNHRGLGGNASGFGQYLVRIKELPALAAPDAADMAVDYLAALDEPETEVEPETDSAE
jgi:hypothetical protein